MISKIAWLLLKKEESFFDYLSLNENASSKARSLSLNHFENLGKNARSSRNDATPIRDYIKRLPKADYLQSIFLLVAIHLTVNLSV